MEDDELEIEEISEEVTPPAPDFTPEETGLLRRFLGLFKGKSKKSAACKEAAQMLAASGYKVDAKKLAAMMDGMGEDEEGEDEPAQPRGGPPMQKSDTPTAAPVPAADNGAVEALMKAQIQAMQDAFKAEREALAKSIQDAAEAKYEAKIKELEGRVEKSEVEKAAETEAREKREYLEKAMTYRSLPGTDQVELADLLYKAHKAFPADDYAKLEATLKAADNLLGASRIFSEFGTARSPEEVEVTAKAERIAKAQNIPLDQAYLQLSEQEQLKLMEEW